VATEWWSAETGSYRDGPVFVRPRISDQLRERGERSGKRRGVGVGCDWDVDWSRFIWDSIPRSTHPPACLLALIAGLISFVCSRSRVRRWESDGVAIRFVACYRSIQSRPSVRVRGGAGREEKQTLSCCSHAVAPQTLLFRRRQRRQRRQRR
jgi:hypothetical protein